MVNNCLVTNFKGAFSNDSLKKLGELCIQRIPCERTFSSDTSRLIFENSEEFNVRTVGQGFMANSFSDLEDPTKTFTEVTIPSGAPKTLYFSDGTYNIMVSEKYTLENISENGTARAVDLGDGFILNLDEVSYCEELTELRLGSLGGYDSGAYGDLSCLKNLENITDLVLSSQNPYTTTNITKISGDISDVAKNSLRVLYVGECVNVTGSISNLPPGMLNINVHNTEITGTSADLGKFTSMDRFHIGGSKITGSIEELVETLVSNGKTTTGSSKIMCYGVFANLTFGGNLLETSTINAHSLEFDGSTKIRVNGASTSTKVWVKGYSAAEIQELIDDGYTVIVIE